MRPPESYADHPATVNTEKLPEATARTHPLTNLFPYFTSQSYAELKEDIRRHGVRLPIFVTGDGLILDGRHREQAARELGIDCPRTVVNLDEEQSRNELFSLVLSANLYRRHMTPEQIAAWFERMRRDIPSWPGSSSTWSR
jgi:ParB-like chromosome segregation protein Spo0J